MAKKKKGGQASSAQQQAAAAARRQGRGVQVARGAAQPGTSGELPAAGQAQGRAEAPWQPAPEVRPLRCYFNVSAVRIQDWLGRTPDLRFRRGASILLSMVTERESWPELPKGAAWNEEAGEVDGVVPLILGDAAASRDAVADIARQVAREIRAKMPCLPLQAVTGTGASYAEAYEQMKRARDDGALILDLPVVPPEVIVAKPCDQCRAAAATEKGAWRTDRGPRDLCMDCAARAKAAGRTAAGRAREPRTERELREALEKAGMTVTDFPDSMADLAAAGLTDGDDRPTQVALIYADGNSVGAFLRAAAGQVPGQEIARAIDEATLGALADAVMDRFAGWDRPPVVASLAGGDDVLVSVPAADAWQFTRVLLTAFGERMGKATAGWPPQARKRLPSLSAGLVFHHLKDPFSDMYRLASDQLREAKKHTSGKAASVAFLDVTADGAAAPSGREAVELSYLGTQSARLGRIREEVPASRRATFLGLLRHGDTERFITRLTDLPCEPLWEVVIAGPAPEAVRAELRKHPEKADELRRILDMARHWTAAPRTDPRPATTTARGRQAMA